MGDAPWHGLDPDQRRMLESEAAWQRHVQGDVPTAERALGPAVSGGVSDCYDPLRLFSDDLRSAGPRPAPMPIPTEVRVGPYRYRVTTDEAEVAKKIKERGSADFVGHTDRGKQVMLLSGEQGPDQIAVTLMHEVMHAITDCAGMREDGKLPPEQFVERTSIILVDTLRRNPALVRFLVAEA